MVPGQKANQKANHYSFVNLCSLHWNFCRPMSDIVMKRCHSWNEYASTAQSSCSGGTACIIMCFQIISPLKKQMWKRSKATKKPTQPYSHNAQNWTKIMCVNPWVKFPFIESLWVHNSSSQDCSNRICHKIFNSTDQARLNPVVTFKCFTLWFFCKYTWSQWDLE